MPKQNNAKSGRAWKLERASVKKKGNARPKSNKFSPTGDKSKKPAPGSRGRAWVGGYTRADGSEVKGYYRQIPNSQSQQGTQASK
jgi:hypothetical protein